jgi:pimeloyl-ACP methyl ester carboxylesterase
MPFLSIKKKKLLLGSIRLGVNSLSYIAPSVAGRIAMEIFCSPQKGRYKELERSYPLLEKAETHWFDFKGLKIKGYRWPGKGKRILLAHGWESNTARWLPTLDALLKEGYEVTAIDAPAHGHSEGKRFTAILFGEALEVAAAHYRSEVLIGHSAGGIAAVYLLTHLKTNHIQDIILLGVPSELTKLTQTYQDMLGFNERVMLHLDREFETRFGNSMEVFSIKEYVKMLEISGLIIHDRKDPIAPYEDMLEAHHNWPASKMITTEGLGHSMGGEAVIGFILSFLGANGQRQTVNEKRET